ncbi:hypothetical protein WJU23_12830 [Prosthecobacter sp. SYSU 5D2]|uniref:hypothetical protein n=1 Tax=Prosthecobacter sp. SYSU 5D2 TaxID=3134134 RepID=UPI0031FF0FF4
MNLADIKHEILQLAPSEQCEIKAYLQEQMKKTEARELSKINAEMDAGDRVSLDTLIAAHEDLVAQGR